MGNGKDVEWMKASIFNFLGDFSSTLEELALRVEDLLWDHPQEAMIKARLFGETLVAMIFEQKSIELSRISQSRFKTSDRIRNQILQI